MLTTKEKSYIFLIIFKYLGGGGSIALKTWFDILEK